MENTSKKNQEKGNERNVGVKIPEKWFVQFLDEVEQNSITKGGYAAQIIGKYYTGKRKRNKNKYMDIPKFLLKSLYDSVDQNKKDIVINSIIQFTKQKLRARGGCSISEFLCHLQTWFSNNDLDLDINWDYENRIRITSNHTMGKNWSEITFLAIRHFLDKKNLIILNQNYTEDNYFSFEIDKTKDALDKTKLNEQDLIPVDF